MRDGCVRTREIVCCCGVIRVDSRTSGGSAGSVWVAVHPICVGVAVHDVLFVLLTLVVFGLLALAAKGAEKL